MAPPSDLPPAPPIPDDELNPRRRRPRPAERQAPEESARNVVTVRFNRRLCWWVVAIGWPLSPVTFVFGLYLQVSRGIESDLLFFVLYFPPLYAAVMGTFVLARANCLTYDVHRRLIGSGTGRIRSALNRWRDGDRLEYSIYLGRLELVRANGRRRSLARGSFTLDRDSWAAFVDVFLSHQSDRAAGHRNAEPSLEDRVPTASPAAPAVKVGVRWRFFVVVLLVGLAATAAHLSLLTDAAYRGVDFDSFGPLALAAAGYVLFGVLPLICNPVLAYESGSGLVSVKTRGLPTREFPRRGYERLEYSVYNGALYEVRADGRRRRVATGRARDQVEWKAFVDRFVRDHPIADSRSTGDEKQ